MPRFVRPRDRRSLDALAPVAAFVLLACSAGSDDVGVGGGSAAGGNDAAGGGGNAASTSSQAGSTTQASSGAFMGNGGGSTDPGCASGPNDDADMDGFTVSQGDCNDCDANVNPAAIEVIADGEGGEGGYVPADEDCDGTVDNPPMPCDTGLALESMNAMDGAKAIELCKQATGPSDWGVISAKWVRADGSANIMQPAQYGILPSFGPNVPPQAGASILGLSSGRARTPGQANACTSQSCYGGGMFTAAPGVAPPGFPLQVCNASPNINDDIGLEVEVRAPKNATGYAFDFRFYSFEFAEWICTSFNDQFIALATPAPMGAQNGNISFDTMGNPVSVNLGFFDSCDTCSDWASLCSANCPPMPMPCCPSGTTALVGTGFELDAGATAWLQTQAPIEGGETVKLRFAIWDAGDGALDSTAIVDNFRWIANGGTVNVGTTPVPQ
jgi:hypothetical protein